MRYNSCTIPCKIVNIFVQKALLVTTLNAYLYYYPNKIRAEHLNIISKTVDVEFKPTIAESDTSRYCFPVVIFSNHKPHYV